ncbi:MAG: quinolinate synthase NadA [Bacteroidetes bacterium]|nr:quinolinate synthase NadA [Bacteroidota bacterium]
MMDVINEINKLKKEKNAVILAHNYQLPEIQDIADFVGDSLRLSQEAAMTDAEIIVFCGVHFMAETASIISPNKKVLIPALNAGCSLSSTITADQLREWRKVHPDAVIVSYVNTTAEVKAESDYCCTSSNAVEIVSSIPQNKKILFLPDRFLGLYVEAMTNRKIEIWQGACHVHEKIGDTSFDRARELYPQSEFLIHPECGCSTSCMLKSSLFHDCKDVRIFSTEGMIQHILSSPKKEFVVATEIGILYRMKKLAPHKSFYPADENAVCEYMKMITLDSVLNALEKEEFEVKVPEELAIKARLPIERMISVN